MRRCCDLDTVCSRRNLYSSLALPAPHVPSSLTEVFAAQAEPEPEPEPVATSAASARWGGLSAALGPGAGGAEDPEARAARVAAAFAAAAGDTESAEILAIKGKLARVKASLKAHAEVAEEGVPPVRFIPSALCIRFSSVWSSLPFSSVSIHLCRVCLLSGSTLSRVDVPGRFCECGGLQTDGEASAEPVRFACACMLAPLPSRAALTI